MRSKTLLNSAIVRAPSASFGVAQTPSAAPKAPTTATSPAMNATTTTTAPATSTSMAPSADEMKQMMEMSKLNDNHKLLASMAGTWNYTVKMWMDPKGKPTESTGTAVRK